ncbi:MAG TPA: right-handed parallel beta-helix repeat-containing protein [Polyangiaceae bacterium]|nr:right-handed parallel beta-helix repeat-containing protein [Polyangiaceae bacterium]
MRPRSLALILALTLVPRLAHAAAEYYVAPTGSDSADGSLATPWATWNHAQTAVKPGDTVYFRAGTYAYSKGTTSCSSETATIDGITLNVSGSAGNTINYFAYPGEVPVFDFSNMFSGDPNGCRAKGVDVTGNYIYLKGLEITGAPQKNMMNHESWGVWVSGSNDTFELLNLHDNMGPGLFIQNGGNNLVLNCDSHDNYDPLTSNGAGQSADGFGCHVTHTTDTGNVFRGCRAWRNSDDGWDLIQAAAVVTIEQCWAWNEGYRLVSGTLTQVPDGNGNGFKGGGYGEPPTNVPATPPRHVIRQNLSVGNKASGFYANHEPAPDYWYNNTGYHNNPNFNLLGDDGTGNAVNVGILRNNLAVSGTAVSNGSGSGVDDQFNSWDASLGVTASDADFQNTSTTGLDAPRQADGSLPDVPNFHLVAGSHLIDKGTDVGLSYAGAAPDLGCFETGLAADGTGGSGGTSSAGAANGGTTASGGRAGAATGGSAGRAMTMTGGSGAMPASGGASLGGTTSSGGTGAAAANGGAATTGGTSSSAAGASNTGATGTTSGGSGGTTSGASAGSAGGPVGTGGGSALGTGGSAGTTAASGGNANDAGGCGCRLSESRGRANALWLLAGIGVLVRRRRARGRDCGTPRSSRLS